MILLRLLSWPHVRTHLLRTLLTTGGIALGVCVFVAMRTANETVLLALGQTVDRIAGRTELQITAGDTGFGEDVLERVQGAATVRVAVPIIEAVVDANRPGQGNLLVLGIDMTGDRSLRDYDFDSAEEAVIDDPLVFLAQPDSIILTRDFAARTGIGVGQRIPLGTVDGPKTFTVRGIMKSSGLAAAFGGNIAVMDVYAAQKMFGRGRTFDRIDLALKEGATANGAQQELRALLGPGFEVETPASRGQQLESVLAGYSVMTSISSAFALFIGMFIIYNAFSIAVTQRRSEIGVLRALGATRAQVRWLFLGESAVMGLVGSTLGLALGLVVARAIAASISALLGGMYGMAQRVEDLAFDPLLLALSVALGVVTSMLGALLPARAAAAVDPVRALQKGSYETLSSGESRQRVIVAVTLAAAAAAGLLFADRRVIFYLGYAAAIGASLALVPLAALTIARALRPLLRWLRPVEGALAADSVVRAPRRTAACVTALMLSLALVIGFGGIARASYDSIVDWMEVTLNPDLFVSPTQSLDLSAARFPASMAPELAAIPGVASVQAFRNGRIMFRDRPAMIVAIEMASVAKTAPRQPIAGNATDMYRRAAAGEGLVVSDNLAQLHRLRLGETLEVAAPYGVVRLPIVGIIVDYSDQQGAILVDRRVFARYWQDDSASDFRVYVAAGTPVSVVRQRIVERYAGRRQVFVLSNAELKSYILGLTNQWFDLTTVQIGVAVLVAVLGIVNTLIVSITERRRELGVLQAVGGLRRQVRQAVWIEALCVGAVGLVLGVVLGAINLYYLLDVVRREVAGMRLDYIFPAATALALVPLILGAAVVAAIWPAESAVRGRLVEALEYE